jgi:hypothetical protein
MSINYLTTSTKNLNNPVLNNSILKLNYRVKSISKDKNLNKYFSFNQSIHATMADFNRLTDDFPKTVTTIHDLYKANWITKGYLIQMKKTSSILME